MSAPSRDVVLGPTGHPGHDPHRPGRRRRGPSTRTLAFRIVLGALVLVVLAFVIFLPVHFPSIVSTHATITPSEKWVLARSPGGQLVGSIFNYRSGMNEGFRVSTFNPGSSINFSLDASLAPGRRVAAGDTVGSIYSSEVQERLIALQGQLAAARSLLAVTASGQKSAVVNEAQQRLDFARRRSTEHQRTEARTQKLFDEHLIAAGEYERVQSEANALRDEINIAAANLEAARTGAKPEQLDLVHSSIAALESEIEAVKRRAATYTVIAPISGTVTPTFSSDTLLTISATDFIALLPIKWTDYRRVATTPRPRVTIFGLSPLPVRATIIALSSELRVLNNHEVVIATAQLEASPIGVMPGKLAQCRIECTPVTVVDYGRQILATVTASRPFFGGF